MLISMPTGTSTIFGVFQAIMALLVNRTNFALADKLVGNEKFASEIFFHKPGCSHVALQKEVTEKSLNCVGGRQNKAGSTGSE
jgi:hypothetical protein